MYLYTIIRDTFTNMYNLNQYVYIVILMLNFYLMKRIFLLSGTRRYRFMYINLDRIPSQPFTTGDVLINRLQPIRNLSRTHPTDLSTIDDECEEWRCKDSCRMTSKRLV